MCFSGTISSTAYKSLESGGITQFAPSAIFSDPQGFGDERRKPKEGQMVAAFFVNGSFSFPAHLSARTRDMGLNVDVRLCSVFGKIQFVATWHWVHKLSEM